MAREINIALDVESHATGERAVRLVMARACGFTRDGGTPTLTDDCTDLQTLEGEAERLKSEIDTAVEQARAHLGGGKKAATRPAREPAPAVGAKPRIASGLKVRDVMTRNVRTIDRNDRLSVADELMKRGRFRHVVVLDEAGNVAGVISRRDIFHGALAWSLGQGKTAHEKSLASFPVKQVMTTEVLTIHPDAELREAAALMTEKKIGCLPVVEGKKLVGIITEGDFLAILADQAGQR